MFGPPVRLKLEFVRNVSRRGLIKKKMKKCLKCRKELGLENFSKDKSRKDKLYVYCKKCEKQKHRKYYLENLDKITKMKKLWISKNLKKVKEGKKKYRDSSKGRDTKSNWYYKVSISDMLEWQDYKCAICRCDETQYIQKLHIDHNHTTGQVRMLLCQGCNRGLKLTDNIELLLAKSEYLKSFDFPSSV